MKIGIIGNDQGTKTSVILHNLCSNLGIKAYILDLNFSDRSIFLFENFNNNDVFIFNLSYNSLIESQKNNLKFDLLIYFNGFIEYLEYIDFNAQLSFVNSNKQNIILLNADDKNTFRFTKGDNISFISFGFNSKSSITASSIRENDYSKVIQYCIQRMIPTISNNKIFPQEFSVTLEKPYCGSIHSELAAITALLVNDLDINVLLNLSIKQLV